jgi:DNA repair exonuclease SbcCD ATPase subunit
MLLNSRSRELLALRAEVAGLETKLRGLELDRAHLQRKIPRLLSEHAALSVRAEQAESSGSNAETARRKDLRILGSPQASEMGVSNQSEVTRLRAELEGMQSEARGMLAEHTLLLTRVAQAEDETRKAKAAEESVGREVADLHASREEAERWTMGFQSEILRLTTELERTRAEAGNMENAYESLRRDADSSAEIAKQLGAARRSAQDQSSAFQTRDLERTQQLRVLCAERDLLLDNVNRDRDCLQDLESALNAVGVQLEETRSESDAAAEAARLVLEDSNRRVADCRRELDVAHQQIAHLEQARDRAAAEPGEAVRRSVHEVPASVPSGPTDQLEEEPYEPLCGLETDWTESEQVMDGPLVDGPDEESLSPSGAGSTTLGTLMDRLRQAAVDGQ